MILYCIDPKSPLYGSKIKVQKSPKDSKRSYIDVKSEVPVKLKEDQLSLYPPEKKKGKKTSG